MPVDILAIGAHPDDIELIAGGTIAKLAAQGYSIAAMDLTRGEMSTRGTPEMRASEAARAAEILGLSERICLDLGDGHLEDSMSNRIQISEQIRRFQPLLVLTHHWHDLHPDHCAAANLIKNTMYTVGMENYPARNEPFRPHEVLFFMGHLPFEPSFIVDIDGFFEKKLEAVKCYQSQLAHSGLPGRPTNISQPGFLDVIEARARHYGSLIQRTFGEPFFARRPVPMADPVAHYKPFSKLF
jgi:N-acetylglucosamine malate deacetylase 1